MLAPCNVLSPRADGDDSAHSVHPVAERRRCDVAVRAVSVLRGDLPPVVAQAALRLAIGPCAAVRAASQTVHCRVLCWRRCVLPRHRALGALRCGCVRRDDRALHVQRIF